MKIVLQRVNKAHVEVDGKIIGSIDKGCIVFLGIATSDNKALVDKLVDKIYRLRIFADSNGKTNLSAKDVDAEVLVVSQFTLMADLTSNRPSFSQGAKPDLAYELYEYFLQQCRTKFRRTSSGRFASHMHVFADNDGPFTLVLEG